MAIARRVFYFLLTNILVMVSVGILLAILQIFFGVNLASSGNGPLLIFCFVFGMVGSFVSLLLSKWMVKRSMGVQVISPDTRDPMLQEVVQMVHHASRSAGLTTLPEVGVYDSPEVNAFATGPSRNNSLVAVSTGLLRRMNREETEGVIGHEVAHIANGDMVTMALVQGVVNAFAMFFSYLISNIIMNALRSRDDDRRSMGDWFLYHMIHQVVSVVFMMLGTIVVAAFSRHREFRADAGSARYVGREKMIAALSKLRQTYEIRDEKVDQNDAIAAFKISNHQGFLSLFSTHPPLEVRLERLQRGL